MHSSLLSWTVLLIGLMGWGVFAYGIVFLGQERAAYAAALEQRGHDSIREETQTRLRAVVRDSASERAALSAIVDYSVVDAVEAIEGIGAAAGARSVTISQAVPQQLKEKGYSAVIVQAQARGTFESLVRAVALFEVLPMPTVVEQAEWEKTSNGWIVNVRLRVILATASL